MAVLPLFEQLSCHGFKHHPHRADDRQMGGIVNIEKDIASFQKVKGRLFSKGYFSVELTDWAYYGSNPDKPEARLRGLHLYFKNREIARLEAMIENVFQ